MIKQIRIGDLIGREEAEKELGVVVSRLPCQHCGTVPIAVELAGSGG